MLTAINEKTGAVIFAGKFKDVRQEYPDYIHLTDPVTGKRVFPRRAHYRDTSFVQGHFVSTACNPSDWPTDVLRDSEYAKVKGNRLICNERLEHVQGKLLVARKAHDLIDPSCKPDRAIYEKIIKLPTGKRRIIDVAFVFPSGDVVAHEVQLASISPIELEERSEDYRSVGINVTWWFGLQAITDANMQWHREYFGGDPPILNFHYDSSTSFHNLHTNEHR